GRRHRRRGRRRHHEAALLLLQDAREIAPPRRALAVANGGQRLHVPLQLAQARAQWHQGLARPAETLAQSLPAYGWRVHRLATDATASGWLRPARPLPPDA